MTVAIQSRWEEMERLRGAVEKGALSLTQSQADWRSHPVVWNSRQIVEHLALSDENVGRPSTIASADAPPLPIRLLPRSLRLALILAAFRKNVALPLPSSDFDPQGNAPIPELLERWRVARDAMRRDLEKASVETLRYAHPILGPLSATQMLDLGIAHTAYHARQAAALRRRPGYPLEG